MDERAHNRLTLEGAVRSRYGIRHLERVERALQRREHLTWRGQQDRHVLVRHTVREMSEPKCPGDRLHLGREVLVAVKVEAGCTLVARRPVLTAFVNRDEVACSLTERVTEAVGRRKDDGLMGAEVVGEAVEPVRFRPLKVSIAESGSAATTSDRSSTPFGESTKPVRKRSSRCWTRASSCPSSTRT